MSAPAPGELVVRPLPTAFDPADGPVTVATPSCCCCCCCCLATTAGAVAFTATDAYYRGKESGVSGGRRVVAFLLGLAAMPIAIAVAVTAAQSASAEAGAAILLSMVAYVVVAVGAFKLAGAPTVPSIGVATLAAMAIAMLFAIELALAIATAFLIELTIPLTIWLGIVISRSRFPTGDGGSEWPPPEQRHVFRPWQDPMSRPPPPPPPPPESMS